MARPITETPILVGKDATDFLYKMKHVAEHKISAEEKKKMMKDYERMKAIAKF